MAAWDSRAPKEGTRTVFPLTQRASRRLLVISGVASVLFGLAAILWPGPSLTVLVLLFGSYVVISGLQEMITTLQSGNVAETWWMHLLAGLVSVGAGAMVLAYPSNSTVVLLYVIIFWAVAIGLVEVVYGATSGQLIIVASGLVAIAFGLILLADPSRGAIENVTAIGIFAIVRGALLLLASLWAPAAEPGASSP